jgi:hypothetical protein
MLQWHHFSLQVCLYVHIRTCNLPEYVSKRGRGRDQFPHLIWHMQSNSDSHESISTSFFGTTDMLESPLREQIGYILRSLSCSLLNVAGMPHPGSPRFESEACS